MFLFNFVIPAQVSAIGQVSDPIVVENALRGQSFEKSTIIMNNKDEEAVFKMSATGAVKDWMLFFSEDNLEKPISEIKILPYSYVSVIARIAIPSDVANGTYEGKIIASETSGNSTSNAKDSSVSVSIEAPREVKIVVGDKQDLRADMTAVSQDYYLAQNGVLKIAVTIANKGNVQLRPDISIVILKDGQEINSVVHQYLASADAIKPLAQKLFDIDWNVNDSPIGDYEAVVTAKVNNNVLAENKLKFAIRSQKEIFSANLTNSSSDKTIFVWYVIGGGLLLASSLLVAKKKFSKKNKLPLN